MKIALISHEGGGISSVSRGLARSLSKKNIYATILTGTPEVTEKKIEIVDNYMKIIRFPIFNIPPKPFWFQLQNFHELFRILRQHDVIHGVSPGASFFYTFYKGKIGKPFVTTIHGSPRALLKVFVRSPILCWTWSDLGDHILKSFWDDFITKRCLMKSDRAVVCSFTTLNDLRSCYKNLDSRIISVVHNGVSFDELDEVKNCEKSFEDGFSIICAGRLFGYKGFILLLKAFEILARNFKDVHLKIFGKGPLEKRVIRFIIKSQLKNNVHFYGYVPRQKLIMEIKRAHVAVLPSIYEAHPVFALESMACKKPIVLFDFPFAREIVTDMENGVLVKPYDINDLYKKIHLLLLDKKLRSKLGQNAYNIVKQKYNWDIQANKYIQIYEEISKK